MFVITIKTQQINQNCIVFVTSNVFCHIEHIVSHELVCVGDEVRAEENNRESLKDAPVFLKWKRSRTDRADIHLKQVLISQANQGSCQSKLCWPLSSHSVSFLLCLWSNICSLFSFRVGHIHLYVVFHLRSIFRCIGTEILLCQWFCFKTQIFCRHQSDISQLVYKVNKWLLNTELKYCKY